MSSAISRLPLRKQKYVKLLAKGNISKKDAAMSVGYSESTARIPSQIETDDVKAAFAQLVRQRIKPSKIIKRISEGMDAVDTQFFAKDGKVTDSKDVVNWKERREYTQIAAQYGGLYSPRQEIDVTQRIDPETLTRLTQVMDKLDILNSSNESLIGAQSSHVPWCGECRIAHIEGQHVIDGSSVSEQ